MNSKSEDIKELKENEIQILNLIAGYLVELNEHRAELYTALKFNKVTPTIKYNFFKSFKRFYDMTASLTAASDGSLNKEIEAWFKTYNDNKLSKGIELSLKHQEQIERCGVFTFFKIKIKPPYIE